jgi:hypothetical protein
MNKLTRVLAMTGMALAATATIAAGAGSAAQAAPAASAKPQADASASQSSDRFGDRTRVIGYYRNAITCHRIGNLGEWRNRWDDHDCYRVRVGFHRGAWVLVAKWDRHGGPGHWNNGGPGHHPGGPGFPGNGGPWNQKNR